MTELSGIAEYRHFVLAYAYCSIGQLLLHSIGMAKDHFERHAYMKGKTDWNFNLLFDAAPQVSAMAERYAPLLQHPGLYPPVPLEWLHLTVLRVGSTSEATGEEMDQVCTKLAPRLAGLALPEFTVGPAWTYIGYPLLHITPERPLDSVFQEVLHALQAVVGPDRMPRPIDRSATKLMPHIALAYPKNYDAENEVEQTLIDHPIPPVTIRIPQLSLIKQWPTGEHYEWEVIKNIPLGQDI
jgi:2'-5' RNA ligase